MDFSVYTEPRRICLQENLIHRYVYEADAEQQLFYLDMNQGGMYVPPQNLSEVLRVFLAYSREFYGEYHAIRALVARVSDLNNSRVIWHRPYHVNTSMGEWITLAQYLERSEKGE